MFYPRGVLLYICKKSHGANRRHKGRSEITRKAELVACTSRRGLVAEGANYYDRYGSVARLIGKAKARLTIRPNPRLAMRSLEPLQPPHLPGASSIFRRECGSCSPLGA
jgi:hypothetical protein